MCLVHSGWHGTALNIAARAITTITKEWGFSKHSLQIGLWPGICSKCYEVGPNVCNLLSKYSRYFNDFHIDPETKESRWQLDLAGAIRQQLNEAGINNSRIEAADKFCSCCSLDKNNRPRFPSYRRACCNLSEDRTERSGLFIMA